MFNLSNANNEEGALGDDAASLKHQLELVSSELAQLLRSSTALQATVDAMSRMPDPHQFIPEGLKIVGRALHSDHCEYLQHADGEPIRMTYWLHVDKVLSSEEVLALGDEYAVMKAMAQGSPTPDQALGVPFRAQIVPTVINRGEVKEPGEMDLFCVARGCEMELNVPLMIAGKAQASLIIRRGPGMEYSPAEIALAGQLGQQFAMAMEISRLSQQAEQAAIARERERVAVERADELARFSAALRFTLDSLVCWVDFLAFVGCLLAVAAEQLQAPVVEYWSADEDKTVKLVLTCRDGNIFEGSDVPGDIRTQGLRVLPGMIGTETLYGNATHFICDDLTGDLAHLSLYSSMGFDLKKWCADRGVQRMINLPLLRGGRIFGGLCAYIPKERFFDHTKIDLAYSLALQLAISIRVAELSEQSKQTALLMEREEALNTRAAEATQANAVLQATLEQLAANRDLLSFPRTILREAIKQLDANDGVILLLDSESNMLRVSELIAPGSSPSDVSEMMDLLVPADRTWSWQTLILNRAAVVLDVERDADTFIPGTRDWLKRRGNQCVVAAPMFLGADPFGYFAIGLRECAEDISKVGLGLIQQLTQQANLAIQLTRLAETSQQNAIALERQQVVIQEREHLSREIHDKLTQGYAAILMQQNALRRSIKSDPSTLGRHLDIIERLSKENLAEARKTMDELRIDPLGPGDLQHALENCISLFDDKYALTVTLEIQDELPPVPHYLELELCRIVGEAITNAGKHSRGRQVGVTAQRINGRLSILVQDDGIGFDPQAKALSFGIASMYERAARAGAELTMTSGPGAGTQVRISLAI